jgi:hypothetical protein
MAHTVAQHNRLQPTPRRDPLTTRRKGPTGAHRKSWTDQQLRPAHKTEHGKIQS